MSIAKETQQQIICACCSLMCVLSFEACYNIESVARCSASMLRGHWAAILMNTACRSAMHCITAVVLCFQHLQKAGDRLLLLLQAMFHPRCLPTSPPPLLPPHHTQTTLTPMGCSSLPYKGPPHHQNQPASHKINHIRKLRLPCSGWAQGKIPGQSLAPSAP